MQRNPLVGLLVAIAIVFTFHPSTSAAETVEAPISTGMVFPSVADTVRFNASILPNWKAPHVSATVGLPFVAGEGFRGIGAGQWGTGNLGLGAAVELWRTVTVLRGGGGLNFDIGAAKRLSLGVSVESYTETVPAEGNSSTLYQSQTDDQPMESRSVLDANLSATYQAGNFRAAVVAHSLKNTFNVITSGVGYSNDRIFSELDLEWDRNQYNDLFIQPGLGIRFDKIFAAIRYYWSYNFTTDLSHRELKPGDVSLGVSYQYTSNVAISLLHHYDPNTYNLALQYRF